ncbi:hypothetical protein A2U01_0065220, partial [Trifolium medium]|nr:hypothetical protein [Trifolium medium]
DHIPLGHAYRQISLFRQSAYTYPKDETNVQKKVPPILNEVLRSMVDINNPK